MLIDSANPICPGGRIKDTVSPPLRATAHSPMFQLLLDQNQAMAGRECTKLQSLGLDPTVYSIFGDFDMSKWGQIVDPGPKDKKS